MSAPVDRTTGSGELAQPVSIDIFVWRCDGGVEVTAHLKTLLDAEEVARADRFVSDRLASLFIQAHGGLRLLLGEALKADPSRLRFGAGPAGKPALAAGWSGSTAASEGIPPLHFNLSHSGDMAAVAVCKELDVGLDIEAFRPVDDGLARRFFDAREADQLEAIQRAEHREAAFFSLWTAKEACLKATGWGIAEGLETFVFDLDGGGKAGPKLARVPERAGQTGHWFLSRFDVAPGFCGTIALKPGGRKVLIRTADVTAFVHSG